MDGMFRNFLTWCYEVSDPENLTFESWGALERSWAELRALGLLYIWQKDADYPWAGFYDDWKSRDYPENFDPDYWKFD